MNTIAVGGNDPRDGRPYSYIETIGGGQGGRWGRATMVSNAT
jgi:N-methylhydantoinase B